MADSNADEGAISRKRSHLTNDRQKSSSCSNATQKLSKYFTTSDTNNGLLSEVKKTKIAVGASPGKKYDFKDKGQEACVASRNRKLSRTFFDSPTVKLAKDLLGKYLIRVLENGEVLAGRIVETEGYLGVEDKACHAYGGRRTDRNEAMYMTPGSAYVYFIYGMYYCFNISSREPGACVLIRALEPVKGVETMRSFRAVKRKDQGLGLKEFQLCNGPSKLCQAMNINKKMLNKEDMALSSQFWLEDATDGESEFQIVTSHRIGINSCPEAALKPLRFYVNGSKSVSVRDKKAEESLPKM